MEKEADSFVIRIWYEATDHEGKITAWRGSIDHIGTRKRLYFCDLDGIIRFIQEQTGAPESKFTLTWWRSVMTRARNAYARFIQSIISRNHR